MKRKKTVIFLTSACTALLIFHVSTTTVTNKLLHQYKALESIEIVDRHGERIEIKVNSRGYYTKYNEKIPDELTKLLLKKEDRFFYFHPGINPASTARAFFRSINKKDNKSIASSTITQQLAKILLENETKRSIKNKLKETVTAISLEYKLSKNEILTMYTNTVYFGNQIQGFQEAANYYFDKDLNSLSETDTLQLLSTISSPSTSNPSKKINLEKTKSLADLLKVEIKSEAILQTKKKNLATYSKDRPAFELNNLDLDCKNGCQTTIDSKLTKTFATILEHSVSQLKDKGAQNGAIVVIKIPENEVLAVVGSVNPEGLDSGNQINMAVSPRPIGSTIKPFIYLKGFEQGLRPYSTVEDREYRFQVKDGFGFYPKNYDLLYRGNVTLEYALANSLNVPTVRVFNYVGQTTMNDFITKQLGHNPVQPIENYELSIALGGLEMSLLNLSHYFTIFGNEGKFKKLNILMEREGEENKEALVENKYIQMVNKILSNRKIGVEQFGISSHLNLFSNNYALKTGTSQKFRDSWIVGYTPEFLVGVWVGNASNVETDGVSGQQGAGFIWSKVMEYMLQSPYSTDKKFNYDELSAVRVNDTVSYSLKDEDILKQKNLLNTNQLILSPHNGDVYLLDKNSEVLFVASEIADWYIDEKFYNSGKEVKFPLNKVGKFSIKAKTASAEEAVLIDVREDEN